MGGTTAAGTGRAVKAPTAPAQGPQGAADAEAPWVKYFRPYVAPAADWEAIIDGLDRLCKDLGVRFRVTPSGFVEVYCPSCLNTIWYISDSLLYNRGLTAETASEISDAVEEHYQLLGCE